MPSRYIEKHKGEVRRIRENGRVVEKFVPHPNYNKPAWGTPLARLDEAVRDSNSTFCHVYAGEICDVIADLDEKTAAKWREIVADKEPTAKVKVKTEDLRGILNQLAAVAA